MQKKRHINSRRNAEVRRELAQIIQYEINDPRVSAFASVTAVEVAPDLKTMKAWISVMGDDKQKADTMAGLKSAEGYIKGCLARGVNMRNTPEIRFILDESMEYGARMSKLIDETINENISDD